MTASSVVSEIDNSGALGVDTISSVSLGAISDATVRLERDLTPDEIEVFSIGGGLDPQRDYIQIDFNRPTPAALVKAFDTQHNVTHVAAEVQDIVSLNSISTLSKAITATTQIDIPNNAISNVNYFENAALLDLDFNICLLYTSPSPRDRG